jgi:hypothetical protein
MSIAAIPISEDPLAAQAPATTTKSPPPKRQVTAKADPAAQPEPR